MRRRKVSSLPIPSMNARPIEYYGHIMPYMQKIEIKGRFIVIEGPDASGRSTQITMITSKLELTSFPIVSNESFTFDYNIKRGVELEFKPRRKNS